MVLAARQHPLERVDADRLPDVVHLRGHVDLAGDEVDADVARLGDVPEVGDEAVTHVGHGRRAERGGGGARVVGRFGPAVRLDEGARGAEAAREDGVPRGGPAEPTRDGDDVARPRPGADDRLLVAHVAERRDRDGDGVAAYEVAADHGSARHLALVAQPVHQLDRPCRGQRRGHDEAEDEGRGHRAHSGDVGEVLRRALAPDVVRGRPVAAEVPALHEDVGAHHDAAVGRGHHRGVVPRAEPHRRRRGES
ncbi:putative thiamine-monophosphate kinase [Streptomyces sp. Tu6071]|nr:putative thiamine-monophosphate kinase [Streptomyces sp. Tu6071]